jgi:hypothetical protein
MNPLDYLTARVEKVVVNSDKIYNEGARLLAHYPTWEYELERFINEAWDVLLRYCIRNKHAKHTATVKLTFASDLIGKRVARAIGIDEHNIKYTLSLGDIFLETFLQDGLVDIFREYSGVKAPYMVRIINQACDLKPVLIGTTFEAPLPITGLFSTVTKEPFIKGWTDSKIFYQYLDQPFVKALESLRQQPWSLNNPLLTAIKENPPEDFLSLVDEDGVIHEWDIHSLNGTLPRKLDHLDGTPFIGKKDPKLQRLVSKYYEYTQVVMKAEMVQEQGYPFYQEVSCDYRGRVYYAESFLEFQGSDIARSLFLFHNKKVVDARGFYWLCVHAAGCFNNTISINSIPTYLKTDYKAYLEEEGLDSISLDKLNLNDRYLWVINNMNIVQGISKHKTILDGAEKPYSLLAVCMEISGYMDNKKKGIPYLSGFPVPIDGSNNG